MKIITCVLRYSIVLICMLSMGSSMSAAAAFGNGAGFGMGLGVANGTMDPSELMFDRWFMNWFTRNKYEKPDVIAKRLHYLEGLMKKQTERLVRRRQEALEGFGGLIVAIKKFDRALTEQEATVHLTPKKDQKTAIADLLSDD